MNRKNPRRASVRAETRTYGTDSPTRQKPRALSITPLHHLQKRWLDDGLPEHMIPATRESSSFGFIFSCLAPWIWRLNRLTGCPSGAGKNVSHTMYLVCQVCV